MSASPPLRFLGIVLGGWVLARAAMLLPPWVASERWTSTSPKAVEHAKPPFIAFADGPFQPRVLAVAGPSRQGKQVQIAVSPPRGSPRTTPNSAPSISIASVPLPRRPADQPSHQPMMPPYSPPSSSGRWSASAWAFFRQGVTESLAAAGSLGGSQLGGRIAYRLNDDAARPLSLSARAYAPVDDLQAAEVALGVEWQPVARLPMRLLVERRQAADQKGRSAFAAMIYGGVNRQKVAGPVEVEAYAQAGIVGTRSRDPFADGSLILSAPVALGERLKLGAGFWGAAQRSISRMDIGPQLSLAFPVERRQLRMNLEWRQRIAGNAAPASGPALTLATDF